MKIHEIINGVPIIVTNEEQAFIDRHDDTVSMDFLDERQEIVANNLIRKGVFAISNDRRYITRIDKIDERSLIQKG